MMRSGTARRDELERHLREAFERAGHEAPQLGPVHVQARMRHRGGMYAAPLVAAAMIGGVVFTVASLGDIGIGPGEGIADQPTTSAPSQPNASASNSTSDSDELSDELLGEWRPISVGENPVDDERAWNREPTLTFKADGAFQASDGCNDIRGEYRVQKQSLVFLSHFQRLLGCKNFQHPFDDVASWELVDARLDLLDASGNVLATYERA